MDWVGVLDVEFYVGDANVESACCFVVCVVGLGLNCWIVLLTMILQAFRHLNAVTVPKMINVPKNEEEDAKRGN